MASVMDALTWARRGFKVFPIRRHGKKPAIEGFELLATQNEDLIRQWWIDPIGRDLDHNIGVLTNGMIVCDLDTKRTKDAIDNFTAIGGHMNTLVVMTPTGGFHVYYTGPDSRLAVDLVHGVDIRSFNGYVIAPGSYVDDPAKGVRGDYTILYDKPVAPVPASIALMQKPPREKLPRGEGIQEDAPGSINAAAIWLTQRPPAIEGSGGDNHTYQTAAVLVRDFALSIDMAFQLMIEHWNPRCIPPWEHGELLQKLENANDYATGALGVKTPEVMFGDVNVPEQPTEQQAGVYQPGLLKFGNALDPHETPARAWISPGVLMRGAATVLVAPGGAGKSLLALITAAHMACGLPAVMDGLTFSATAPRRSVIVNAEDDLAEQSRRLQAICTAYNLPWQTVKQHVMLIAPDVFSVFLAAQSRTGFEQNDATIKYIIDMVRSFPDVDLLGLDPLLNLHGMNENDNSAMNFLMRSIITRIARETGTAVLVSHHAGKQGSIAKRAGDVDMSRGAGAIINAARIALTMTPPAEDDIQEYHLTDPYSYVRIDDAKANVHKMLRRPRWMKWDTVKTVSTDGVGVLLPTILGDRNETSRLTLAKLLHGAMIAQGKGRMGLQEAAQYVIANDPLYQRSAVNTVRSTIERMFSNVYEFEDEGRRVYIKIERAMVSGRNQVFVVMA
jgi:hypothetical protein